MTKSVGVEKNEIHAEGMRGSVTEAVEYCKKEKKWWECGQWITQGQRTDLEAVATQLLSGEKNIEDIMAEQPTLYCKYRGGIKDIAGLAQKNLSKEFRKIDVKVYWGAAGSGKTRKAVEENCDDVYIMSDSEWWDGYNGEKTIILDDFYGWCKYHDLLRWLDGYQLRLKVKGSFTYAAWDKVIITSNKHPSEWYSVGLTDALERRISDIQFFGKCDEVPPGNTRLGVGEVMEL